MDIFDFRERGNSGVDEERERLATAVIGAAIEVHRTLGPGLLESPYKVCLVRELITRGLRVESEVPVPVTYKGLHLDCGFRLDLLVDGDVIVEVKSVAQLLPVHSAQVITYLKLTDARRALLFNFNEVTLIAGMRSFLGRGRNVPAE